jgi:RNA 2',3'-cyclic 3'-phosphodiesterase
MRLFTALDLPDQTVSRLDQLIARLKPTAHISWSAAANLHITTKFIGEWPETRLGELETALRHIPSRQPIEIRLHEVGFFPNSRSPRTFWCGIEAPGLQELAADTDSATSSLGIASENRPYSPHLTMARIKERLDLSPLQRAIAREASLEFGRFEARSFFLFRSQLRPTGSVYTKLSEFPLTHS